MNWKRKLTSRKFWMAVIGFVAPLLLAFGKSQDDVTQIVSIIMAGGTLIAYILGEGFVDAANVIPEKMEEIRVIPEEMGEIREEGK